MDLRWDNWLFIVGLGLWLGGMTNLIAYGDTAERWIRIYRRSGSENHRQFLRYRLMELSRRTERLALVSIAGTLCSGMVVWVFGGEGVVMSLLAVMTASSLWVTKAEIRAVWREIS